MKKAKVIFFVLEYIGYPGHYYIDSYCSGIKHKNRGWLSTTDILRAKRFSSKKEALKNKSKNKFKIYKVKAKIHSV